MSTRNYFNQSTYTTQSTCLLAMWVKLKLTTFYQQKGLLSGTCFIVSIICHSLVKLLWPIFNCQETTMMLMRDHLERPP